MDARKHNEKKLEVPFDLNDKRRLEVLLLFLFYK
jgi:hypothetical protein